jgi:hydrogenase expression/formation protein HypE
MVSGTIAEHGVAVMNARHELGLGGPEMRSDCAPLGELVLAALAAAPGVHTLRDPTRGGVATALVEIAHQSNVRIVVEEAAVPMRLPVRRACEMLGIDPFYVASEGRMLAVVPQGQEDAFLTAVRSHPLGRDAARIGRIEAGPPGVALQTVVGGLRPLIMLEGDPLPRIC